MAFKRKRHKNGSSAKKTAQKLHAKMRAQQRFGLNLNRSARIHIMNQIKTGSAITIKRSSLRASVKLIRLPDGQLACAAYDNIRHNVVSLFRPHKIDILLALIASKPNFRETETRGFDFFAKELFELLTKETD